MCMKNILFFQANIRIQILKLCKVLIYVHEKYFIFFSDKSYYSKPPVAQSIVHPMHLFLLFKFTYKMATRQMKI